MCVYLYLYLSVICGLCVVLLWIVCCTKLRSTRFSFTLKQFAEDLTNSSTYLNSSYHHFAHSYILQITVKIACAFCFVTTP